MEGGSVRLARGMCGVVRVVRMCTLVLCVCMCGLLLLGSEGVRGGFLGGGFGRIWGFWLVKTR